MPELDGVFLVESQINRLAELWPIGTNFNNVEMKMFDFIGLIFFMLSRIEERNITQTDKHDRFLTVVPCLSKTDVLATPVVDEVQGLPNLLLKRAFHLFPNLELFLLMMDKPEPPLSYRTSQIHVGDLLSVVKAWFHSNDF